MAARINWRQIQLLTFAVLFTSSLSWGQVRIHRSVGGDVPKEKVDLLFSITCRVVAEEFHLHDASEVRVPITLVLGDTRQGVVGNETNQVFTIYMPRWDDILFVTAVSRIAIQHLLSQDRKARIVSESLRRASLVAPVPVSALKAPVRRRSDSSTGRAPASPRAAANQAAHCISPEAFPLPAEQKDLARIRFLPFCAPADAFVP